MVEIVEMGIDKEGKIAYVHARPELGKKINLPDVCPECGETLIVRGELNQHEDGSYDEVWECANHHLFRAIYVPVKFVMLKEAEKDES